MTEETTQAFFTDPVVCYFLDAFLMFYCVVFTALFFREKYSSMPSLQCEMEEFYQELGTQRNADPYETLEVQRRKKTGGKKKAKRNHTQQRDLDPYESLNPTSE